MFQTDPSHGAVQDVPDETANRHTRQSQQGYESGVPQSHQDPALIALLCMGTKFMSAVLILFLDEQNLLREQFDPVKMKNPVFVFQLPAQHLDVPLRAPLVPRRRTGCAGTFT